MTNLLIYPFTHPPIHHIRPICHVCHACRTESFTSVQLLDEVNMCTMLRPGRHLVLPAGSIDRGQCGLVPIQGKVRHITSSGLQWNLEDSSLELGVFISVCNKIDQASYVINSDGGSGSSSDSSKVLLEKIAALVGSSAPITMSDLCCYSGSGECKDGKGTSKWCCLGRHSQNASYSSSSSSSSACSSSDVLGTGVYVHTTEPVLWTNTISL
jgi:hypothetical protein